MYEYNINDGAINDQAAPLRQFSQEESVYGNLKDSDWRALIAIAKSPEGMGTRELAQAANFSRPYATEVGNRLVKLGYVNVKKLPTKPKETSIYLLSSNFNREETVAVGEAVIQRQQPRILLAKDASQIRDFEELQSILAQESTLTQLIYRCLEKNKGKTVKELEEELGKSGSFINVHLIKLFELGLVIRQKESKAFVYFLAPGLPEEHNPASESLEQSLDGEPLYCSVDSARASDSPSVEHEQELQQQTELPFEDFMKSTKSEAPISSSTFEQQSEASGDSRTQSSEQTDKSVHPTATFEDKVWKVLKYLAKEVADIKSRIVELEKGKQRASAYDDEEILQMLNLDDSDDPIA